MQDSSQAVASATASATLPPVVAARKKLRPGLFQVNGPDVPGLWWKWLLAVFMAWSVIRIPFFPNPVGFAKAFRELWMTFGLAREIGSSVVLYVVTMLVGVAIAASLTLLHQVWPIFRPPIGALTFSRFLTMAGVSLFLMVYLGVNYWLKFWLMVGYQAVMLLPMLLEVKGNIEPGEYDHARTIYTSEWMVTYEVICRGCLLPGMRQVRMNQCIGVAMLFIVEGYTPAEGGIGALMVQMMKHPYLPHITVLLAVSGLMGVGIYYAFNALEKKFPWATNGNNH